LGLCVSFGDRQVLDHVDIEIHPHEIVTVVGLNGSGKSTLARVLLGLIAPDSGLVIKRADLITGYVPQISGRDTTMPLTVARFVGLAGPFGKDTITRNLASLGIGALADAQLATLSGGELRRALLARALIRKPQLLVLDEPMSGVDVAGQVELYRIIGRIRREQGCGILLISHDLHLVMAETDRVVCLNHHVCCAGGPQAVLKDPSFAALFGQDVADALAVYRHSHDHVHDAAGHVHPPGAAHHE
jgi:zinc transport system ATP-binding protein